MTKERNTVSDQSKASTSPPKATAIERRASAELLRECNISLHPLARATLIDLIADAVAAASDKAQRETLKEAAAYLRAAMSDVPTDLAERLHTSDVERLADELEAFADPSFVLAPPTGGQEGK